MAKICERNTIYMAIRVIIVFIRYDGGGGGDDAYWSGMDMNWLQREDNMCCTLGVTGDLQSGMQLTGDRRDIPLLSCNHPLFQLVIDLINIIRIPDQGASCHLRPHGR